MSPLAIEAAKSVSNSLAIVPPSQPPVVPGRVLAQQVAGGDWEPPTQHAENLGMWVHPTPALPSGHTTSTRVSQPYRSGPIAQQEPLAIGARKQEPTPQIKPGRTHKVGKQIGHDLLEKGAKALSEVKPAMWGHNLNPAQFGPGTGII